MSRTAWIVGFFLLVVACSDDSPVAPDATNSTPAQSNLITITSAGVSPKTVEIQVGERVVFTNNDSVDHEMSSDLHPTHTECPEINQVGYLEPGETRETGNFVRTEICTFHDHINSTNTTLNGSIIITE